MRFPAVTLLSILATIAACGGGDSADTAAGDADRVVGDCTPPAFDVGETVEITPGLDATLLQRGYGRRVVAGDTVVVDYTGWLFDPNAEGGKGTKFDSSVDRDQRFEFPLGAKRVIRGWDQGVECMLLGEKRLLKIAPELGYGARGAGATIPPNATLLFEIKVYSARGPGEDS